MQGAKSGGGRPLGALWLVVVLLVGAASIAGPAVAGGRLYTTDADFDLGVLTGVNHTPPNVDQLQLNVTGSTFPVMWIANSGDDTVSKVDTTTGNQLARYRTWFNVGTHDSWSGPAPSRTAVDAAGNCYVLNRHFDGRPPLLMKIVVDGYFDRNGNGVMDTSTSSVPLALTDNNPPNGKLDPAELADERVAWAVEVGPVNSIGRALCIGADGYLYVGLWSNNRYYKVDPANGFVYSSYLTTAGNQNYGCLVDSSGTLWGTRYQDALIELNTNTGAYISTTAVTGPYTLALGPNGHIFMSHAFGRAFSDIDTNVTPHTVTYAVGSGWTSYGVNVDAQDNIVSGGGTGGMRKYSSSPPYTLLWSAPLGPRGGDTRAAIVDSENNIWQVYRTRNSLVKFKGSDGSFLGEFTGFNLPYTYSDATGFALMSSTTKTGRWTAIQNGGKAGAKWGTVNWTDSVPSGAGVEVNVRAANSVADLTTQFYTPVTNGTRFDKAGQYIQVDVKLTANNAGASPILYDLTVKPLCDVNGDLAINVDDINLIGKARGTTNALYDIDKDGLVTVYDTRTCTVQCDKTNCAK